MSNVRDSLVKNKNFKISFYILTREILAYSRLIRNFHIRYGILFRQQKPRTITTAMEINKKIVYNTITDQEKIQIRPISTRDILRTRATR